jgi:hypothetical protein
MSDIERFNSLPEYRTRDIVEQVAAAKGERA